jgi:hypothetical protein
VTSRKALPAMGDLRLIKLRLSADLQLHEDDRTVLIDLIDAIIDDKDVRDKFWRSMRGRPEKDSLKKALALSAIFGNSMRGIEPTGKAFDEIATEFGLTFDVVKHVYQQSRRAAIKK